MEIWPLEVWGLLLSRCNLGVEFLSFVSYKFPSGQRSRGRKKVALGFKGVQVPWSLRFSRRSMPIFRAKDFKERNRQGLSRTTLCELELKIISLLSAPCTYTGGLLGDGC